MLVFPNCKINLGLHVTVKRADGFHNLETVFYPIPLYDALEIIEEKNPQDSPSPGELPPVSFSTTGLPIPSTDSENLCVKAYRLLKNDFLTIPPVKMHLHKLIPLGAGLGGGSSNGAFALQLVNQKFNLDLSESQLMEYALRLGSDCPFFILNKPCFASGRGELLESLAIQLKGYHLVLVNPGIHISTKEAFSNISPKKSTVDLRNLILQPVYNWKDSIRNDFEPGIFKLHPAIGEIKAELYRSGALYAAMTGTGSTVFGIFKTTPTSLPVFGNAAFTRQIELT